MVQSTISPAPRTAQVVMVQCTISKAAAFTYGIKYNKLSVIFTLSNLFSYCKKYNK